MRSASAARTVSRPGSPGPSPDEGDPAGGLARAAHRVLPNSDVRAGGDQLGGEPPADRLGVVERPVADSRTASEPSAAVTEPRRKSLRDAVIALGDLGEGADRRGATRLQGGEQGALGERPRPGSRRGRARRACATSSLVGRAALDGERALRRRRQHLQRVEQSRSPRPAGPAGPGRPGQHHRVQLAGGHLAAAGCPRCRGSAPPRRRGRARAAARPAAASRCRSGRRAAARPSVSPSRAHQHVARVLARAARRRSPGPAPGRSAGPCTSAPRRRSRRPSSASRSAETKTPVPPIWVSGAPSGRPSVTIWTISTCTPGSLPARR